MDTELSHKDLVKLGIHESKKGRSLSEIEDDFEDKDIKRADAMKALKVVDYYNKKEALKAKKEEEAKRLGDEKAVSQGRANAESGTGNKSSFWVYLLVFLVLVGLALFYYLYKQ